VLAPYAKKPDLLPRKTHHVLAGPPVDLERFYDKEMTPELLKEATEVIMTAITGLLGELRGEQPPQRRYDPREARIAQRRKAAEVNTLTEQAGSAVIEHGSPEESK
jgi:hypothetical protein